MISLTGTRLTKEDDIEGDAPAPEALAATPPPTPTEAIGSVPGLVAPAAKAVVSSPAKAAAKRASAPPAPLAVVEVQDANGVPGETENLDP